MQELAENTLKALNNPGRELETKLELVDWQNGEETIKKEYTGAHITNWTIDESASTDGTVTVGAVTAAKLTITLNGGYMNNQAPQMFEYFKTKQKMRLYIRAKLSENSYTDWIPLGAYYCDDVKRVSWVVTVIAYDAMVLTDEPYSSTLKFPTQANDIIKDIADTIGFSYILDEKQDFTVITKPEGKTCREVLSEIASANLCNARLNREGKFVMQNVLRHSPITVDKSQAVKYDFSDEMSHVNKVKIENDGIIYEYGSGASAFEFKNELLNKVQRDNMMSALNLAPFYTGSCELRGDLRIEPGDYVIVTVPYRSSIRGYNLSVVDQQLTFNGGLRQTIQCDFNNELQQQYKNVTSVKEVKDGSMNYAVFSKLPNVMPDLPHNTLICELKDISDDGVLDITKGKIGTNSEYTLYDFKNIYLYQKQLAYIDGHTPYINYYTEAAQSMEEIILPTKLRAWCGRAISKIQDYEELKDISGIAINTKTDAEFDKSMFLDKNFTVYNSLVKCKKLIFPEPISHFAYIGDCPLLEEVVIHAKNPTGGGNIFKKCPSLHTIRFDYGVNNILTGFIGETNISDVYLCDTFGMKDGPSSTPLTDNGITVRRISIHSRGLRYLGRHKISDGTPESFFTGNSIREIVLPEGTQQLYGNAFLKMESLECITFPGYYGLGSYSFTGPAFTAIVDGDGNITMSPIFNDCPNLKTFRCRHQDEGPLQNIVREAADIGREITIEYID